MKKKSFYLVAAASFMLAACAPANTNNNSQSASVPSNSASVTPASSSSEGYTASQALLYFLRYQMQPANTTLSIKDPSAKTTVKYFMGDDAIVFDKNGTQSGVLVNGEQGLFEFDVNDDDTLTLGQSYGRETTVLDTMYNPSFLYSKGGEKDWTIGEEGYTYTMSSKPGSTIFGAYGTMLLAGNSAYIQYLSSVTLKLADDLSSATVKFRYNIEGSVATYTGTFSKFGTTSVKAVENYLKSPVTQPNATEYSKTAKTIATSLFGDASITPFPTGLVDYAFRDDYLTDQEGHPVGFQWTYYGKNITEGWTKILADKGYVEAEAPAKNEDGYLTYTYKYVLEAATETTPERAAVAKFHYMSDDESFLCQFSAYTGVLEKSVASVADLNAEVAKWNASESVVYTLPDFEANNAITAIRVTDGTAKFANSYSFYYYVEMDIADSAAALAYLQAYATKLEATTFAVYTQAGVTLEKDGAVLYFAHNDNNTKYSLVELDHGTSTTNAYNGTIGVVFYGK